MLYLGQVCKFEEEFSKKEMPAIFLGFKVEGDTRLANLLFLDYDGELKTKIYNLTTVGFLKIKDDKSPTGKSIYRGEASTGVVNEYIMLKPPAKAMEILKKAEELMLV